MDDPYWVLGLVFVLFADLVVGVALGWFARGSLGSRSHDHPDREALERLFQRHDDLYRAICLSLRQVIQHSGRLGQMREQLRQLPENSSTPTVTLVIDSMEELSGELASTHDNLRQQLDLSQEAAANAQRAYAPTAAKTHAVAICDRETDRLQPKAIHKAEEDDHCRRDARSEDRHPYPHEQMAAPYVLGQIPKRDAFQLVQCCDLSSSGVSFMATDPPKSDMIVITIGDEPNLVYRTARIVQVAEMQSKEAGRRFRVGCQFTGRLHRHLFA